ncbi:MULTISPECIES: SDR family oxidoreductase [Sphingopyxis]|jgi:NAD(P)-dependent dehydrogenase (short-subunit alcohol dehydrogenase family)|uniref:SDR family oxidoreductase n=1 Tax=Sphingopyxis TaxID=165697 RepID=UPI0002D1F876|nr:MULTISPECIES: SDR family oxidoreductase [Sphingopyxis]ENY82135.1 short-chain dehydrogenase/reductase SDR [Sphingopyxis sp. MC1]KAB2855307.1 MAG: SDR family oxidoreductase [Sphingopyxis terrae]MDX8356243.1 SDR family oxidoreductase [Sphingopyxis terrae]OJW22378.1 MAG: 3-oxoacyl-ACP reductase [Sphingopyxis sp. 65-8]
MNLNDMFGLNGRIALVTGGSRGIGKMIVEGYLAAGCARVYISARKTAQIEEAVADFETRYPGKVIGLPVDLSTVEGCRALAKELEAREEKLDILVNNAGAAWGEPFENFPEAGWDKVMDINVKSPFFLTQALHNLLKAAGTPAQPAKVINIGSIDGMRLNPWETYSYHASKAAILYLTKRMAARLVQDNILVTAIAPGAFQSDMNKAARDHGDAVAKSIPTKRIGVPEDMAGAAIFLASKAGDYVVGETIAVDGGLVHGDLKTSIDA